MLGFNLSATVNVSRLLYNPSLCLPHLTVKSFDQLTIPFKIPNHPQVQIKGVVLDKDNCFAKDHDDKVWPEYEVCIIAFFFFFLFILNLILNTNNLLLENMEEITGNIS